MKSPSFATAALRIFDLSLGEMLWSKRTIFMALVVAGPVAIAAIVRVLDALGLSGFNVAGSTVFGAMIWVYLRFNVPVLAVFYGTALIADEVEDKTITYLFTRPIPRGAVVAGKYLAYLACTVFVILPSVVIVYLLIAPLRGSLGGSFVALVTDLGLLGLGLAVYGAVFALIGARLKRPLIIGLFLVFGWEPVALLIPGYLRRFTVAYYLDAMVPHPMPQDSAISVVQSMFRESLSAWVSLAWLGLITAVCLLAAMRTVERREYVLEQ